MAANGRKRHCLATFFFYFTKILCQKFLLCRGEKCPFYWALFIYVFLLENFVILLNILTFVNDEEKRPIALVA